MVGLIGKKLGMTQVYNDKEELIPVTVDKPAWILTNQPERCMPEFREFFAVYDAIGNTPMPGVTFQPATQREAVTGPLEYLGQGTIKHEI